MVTYFLIINSFGVPLQKLENAAFVFSSLLIVHIILELLAWSLLYPLLGISSHVV